MHDYAISLLAFAAAARLAFHRAELAEADHRLTQAMRMRPACTYLLPFLATRGRLQLAKVYLAEGDHATTRYLVREIEDVLRHRPRLGALNDEYAEFQQVAESGAAGSLPGVAPLTPAELRLLPYLQTHLTIAEIAERLQVSRNTVGTQVTSIYRKLGGTSRSEAVRQATLHGLLGG